MKITVHRKIPFDAETVWSALTSEALLRQSIPGCRKVLCVDHARWQGDFDLKLNGQALFFRGTAQIVMACPPERYTMHFVMKHAVWGEIHGKAQGKLLENAAPPGMTLAHFDVDLRMKGSFMSVPFYFFESSIAKLSDVFFTQLIRNIAKQESERNKNFSSLFRSLLGASKNTVSH